VNEWPKDSIQDLVGEWWIEKNPRQIERGRLIWAYLPHIAQQPMILIPEGRPEPTEHNRALFSLEVFDIDHPPVPPKMPVAALPFYSEETRMVFRTKKRPALILCQGGAIIEKGLRTGGAKKFAPTCLVAPYYGGDQSGRRAGFKDEFKALARRAAWPQFIWDMLPVASRTNESILRLDHLQPIPRERNAIQLTPFCLSRDAQIIVDEWLDWLMTGTFSEDSLLLGVREDLLKLT